MSRKTHKQRTEWAAEHTPKFESQTRALWQIAHSLAAIADALEPPDFELDTNLVTGPPEPEGDS